MLPDSQKPLDVRFFLFFIPVAYISYLFHEFGHWSVGEILGNRMVYSLNNVWPQDGHYLRQSHEVYVSIGGPGFSVLQAVIALLIIEKFGTLYAYPFAFIPMFNRFFSDLFTGFSNQDEARIAVLMGTGTYLVAILVLAMLVLIVTRCSSKLRIGAKNNGYIIAVTTVCQLLVIGTYKLFSV